MGMRSSKWKRWSLFVASLATAAFLLQGCGGGSDGSAGPAGSAGPTGATGPAGPSGTDLVTGSVDAKNLNFNDLRDRALAGEILSVDTSGDKPVVKFKVTMKDTGEVVKGLRTFALHIAQLQPTKDGSPSYWLNYILTTAAPNRPTTDAVTTFKADGTVNVQGYSVSEAADGTYSVTFAKNIKTVASVPYDASLTHRVVVGVRSVAVPGNYINAAGAMTPATATAVTTGAYGGPINPTTNANFAQFLNTNGANLVYDFIPATGVKVSAARDNVTMDACNQCHYKLNYGSNNTSGHFGSRTDTKTCVMCHTPQNVDPAKSATTLADFTPFIHKIHMGEELPAAEPSDLVNWAEIKFPQDQRNCATCHKGTVTDSWKTPSIKACGACHNNVNFATGANHIGGSKADNKQCSICHGATDIATYHLPVAEVTSATSGITSRYAHNANLPTGAYKIEYVLNSVTLDSSRRPVIKFGIKKDGALVNFGTYNATTHKNFIDNTVGGPSFRIEFNVPQDGKTPSDFNANVSAPAIGVAAPTVSSSTATPPSTYTAPVTTTNLWVNGTLTVSGVTWTLTGPAADGYYTITTSLAMPAATTMVNVLMYGSMTQTNLADKYAFAANSIADYKAVVGTTSTTYAISKPGLILNPQVAMKAAAGTGLTARRTIVDNAKCNACHEQLGLFTKAVFHGGARNDGTACMICHTANGNNNGWSYAGNTFIHAIHGAGKRTTKYTFQAASTTDGFFTVGYPGVLKNCEQCHLAGTYDYSATASAAAVDNLLYDTVATGTVSATVTQGPAAAGAYGSGFSVVTTTGAVVTTEPAGTTLVNSPISAACYACHDTATAKNHMEINGGSIYAARTAALAKKETCLICHGAASSTNGASNPNTPTIKSVHRWW